MCWCYILLTLKLTYIHGKLMHYLDDAQVAVSFSEWCNICDHPTMGDSAYTHYIVKLQQDGLLKGDDLTDRFYHILTVSFLPVSCSFANDLYASANIFAKWPGTCCGTLCSLWASSCSWRDFSAANAATPDFILLNWFIFKACGTGGKGILNAILLVLLRWTWSESLDLF